jgi:hypothetical protein
MDDGITCGLPLRVRVACLVLHRFIGWATLSSVFPLSPPFSLGFPFSAIDQSDGFGLIWFVLFKDGRLDDDKLIMVIRIVFFPDG